MYRLVFLSGPTKGRRITIEEGDVVIGSDPDSHVELSASSVLGKHAILEERPKGIYIKALVEGAPLQVNDIPVIDVRLKHSDEIHVGDVRLLFQTPIGPEPVLKRRRSKFHGLTFSAVILILFAQLIILAGLFIFWRVDPIPDAAPPPLTAAERAERLQRRLLTWSQQQAEQPADFFRYTPEWIVTPEDPGLR